MNTKTTHNEIDSRILELEDKIAKLKSRKDNSTPEPAVKQCERCKTMNSHYSVDSGSYVCAFC